MTKMERIAAAIRGDAVDTVPYSLWSHLPLIDLDPVKNAEQTYGFYKTYDVDILKTMNNGMYSVEDFGAVADYSEIAGGGVAKIVSTPVHRPMRVLWQENRNTCGFFWIRQEAQCR